MTYEKACSLLGFSTKNSLARNAELAESHLRHQTLQTPLRFSVAAWILVKAAK